MKKFSCTRITVGGWCAISLRRVIGPIFFDKSTDSDVYTGIIQNFIALLEEDERYTWFQQDGATAHTAKKIMDVLTEFFEDRIISKGTWPARSPNLTPPDFFLCAYLKNSVYLNKPTTVDELKTEIEAQIHNIDKNTYKHVFQNMIRRLDACQSIGEASSNITYDYKNSSIENNFLIKFKIFVGITFWSPCRITKTLQEYHSSLAEFIYRWISE